VAIARDGAGSLTLNGGEKTSGTTLTGSPTVDVVSDRCIVIGVAFDNLSTNTPTVTASHSGSATITWSTDLTADSHTGTGAAGVRGAIITGLVSAGTLLTTDVVTLTFSGAITAKRGIGIWLTGVDPTTPLRTACNATANGTGTAAAVASADALASGECAYAFIASESTTAPSADGDSTNGSWTTAGANSTTGGGSNTNVSYRGSFKVVSGAGTQTINGTVTSESWAALIVALQPPTTPATRAFTSVASRQTQAVRRASSY